MLPSVEGLVFDPVATVAERLGSVVLMNSGGCSGFGSAARAEYGCDAPEIRLSWVLKACW